MNLQISFYAHDLLGRFIFGFHKECLQQFSTKHKLNNLPNQKLMKRLI